MHISAQAWAELTLLDLRGDGCTRIGASTDVVKARNHAAGRAFAKSIHAAHVDVDEPSIPYARGVVYAVFKYPIGKLTALETELMQNRPELSDISKQ